MNCKNLKRASRNTSLNKENLQEIRQYQLTWSLFFIYIQSENFMWLWLLNYPSRRWYIELNNQMQPITSAIVLLNSDLIQRLFWQMFAEILWYQNLTILALFKARIVYVIIKSATAVTSLFDTLKSSYKMINFISLWYEYFVIQHTLQKNEGCSACKSIRVNLFFSVFYLGIFLEQVRNSFSLWLSVKNFCTFIFVFQTNFVRNITAAKADQIEIKHN